jgi:hypothetical protein
VYISCDVVFDKNIFPFASLHPNASALLKREILLLSSSTSTSHECAQNFNDHMTPIVPVTNVQQTDAALDENSSQNCEERIIEYEVEIKPQNDENVTETDADILLLRGIPRCSGHMPRQNQQPRDPRRLPRQTRQPCVVNTRARPLLHAPMCPPLPLRHAPLRPPLAPLLPVGRNIFPCRQRCQLQHPLQDPLRPVLVGVNLLQTPKFHMTIQIQAQALKTILRCNLMWFHLHHHLTSVLVFRKVYAIQNNTLMAL